LPRKPIEGNPSGVRIDLGTKERQILEDFALSYRLKSVLPSVTNILTDVSALYAIGVLLELIFDIDLPLIVSPTDVMDFWQNVRNELKIIDPEKKKTGLNFLGGFMGIGSALDLVNYMFNEQEMNEAQT
jgi:hypothetical protein